MAIPITIEKLISGNTVEWARIEFKEGWNPEEILKTICAFANDIDNWGGGYIVIGAKENKGVIERPVKGIEVNSVDSIQKELLRYCKLLDPSYIPIVEPVYLDEKMLLLIWCPGGYDRPYTCPKTLAKDNRIRNVYIRKTSNTINATKSDRDELNSLAEKIPFDDRVNYNADIKDLKLPIIKNYLQNVNSSLLENIDNLDIKQLSKDLRIAGGTPELYKPLNVGLLMFNDRPENFFPYAQIDIVNIPDPTGEGMEERSFVGPIDEQLRSSLNYIKNNIIAEKVFKISGKAESKRIKNYSFEAIEEFLSNAVYHKSYQIHEPITVRIETDKIEITSLPGPDRSIKDEDIKTYQLRSRRYRNRRIGDFLKDLHLIEGRNTGFPTAIKSIKANGSPLPLLLTDNDRSFFTIILPIHKAFLYGRNKKETSKKISIRRSKDEIMTLILKELHRKKMSSHELYLKMGYSGNPSKTFRECVDELIKKGKVAYDSDIKQNSNNVLYIKNK